VRLPTPFGKYLLLERISVGGMAEVFKAKAFGVEGFEKIIAIKKILPSMAEDADFIQMFIDEAKICGQLNHANICQIFELGRIDDSHFIAMEYIWGKDLLQIQNRFRRIRKNMTVQMAAFLASKMCEGLDYAHRKKDATGKPLNIIHRDVSPQNVIVSYEGEVKVIDFGIAKAASRSAKTQAGVLKGKFGYMSPEQVAGKTLDQRADIFAIGTILYELLTNERLFLGESDFATLEKVRNVAVPPPSQVNKEIPPALDSIIMKALAKDTDSRYQWASEMHDDLQDFLAQTEPVYNAKALSTWMRAQFVVEMRKEAAVLDEQRKIGKEAMNADKGPSKSTTPPSARLRSPTIAPAASAPKSTSPPAPAAEAIDPELASELEAGSLLDEIAESEDGGLQSEKTAIVTSEHEASALLNEKTSIVAPGQGPGDLPAQSTQILGGPPGGSPDDKGPGDLAALSTVVFNPDSQHAPPPPVAQGAPGMQAADPFTSTLGPAAYQDQQQQQQQQQMQLQLQQQQQQLQLQQMQMQMQMQQQAAQGMSVPNFQAAYGSGGMPVMAVPYGTGSMSAMPGANHTGMMMLPNGTIVPFSGPMPQPAAPVKGSTLWKDILVGIAAAVAVVGLVLGLKFVLTPKKGTVVLTVTPQRPATVFMDGEERGHIEPGAAFLLKELTRGPHLLLVRTDDGAAQLTQTIEVAAGELTPVTLQLSASGAPPSSASSSDPAAGQGSGILRLRLPPDGALVSVNGRLINEKDIQKGYLVPAGVPQEVVVKKAGKRPVTFSETLKPGEEKERTIELKDGRGRLVISTRPPGVDIQVNGRSYGKSPVTVEDLDPTKAAKVVAKKRGVGSLIKLVSFGESFDQTLDLDFGTPSSGGSSSHAEKASSPPASSASPPPAAAAPAPGSDKEGFLIANSQPYAKVLVDGKDTGKVTPIAPRDHIPLKPGKHVITFVTSDKRVSADVIIKSGEEAKVVRNLTE